MQHGQGDDTRAHRSPDDDDASGAPLHLGDIQADDALIDALGSGTLRPTDAMATSGDVDDRLAAMLATWVAAVQDEPPAEAPFDPDAVIARAAQDDTAADDSDSATALRRGRGSHRRNQPRYAVRLSAAAAVALVVIGGVAVGNAGNAHPGDVTWPIARVVFPEHARSVVAADDVAVHLDRARTALREGRTADAAREVNEAQAIIGSILPADGRATLGAEHTSIVAVIAATPDAVLLDPGLRAPAVPDVAGAEALGLPTTPGLPPPDPSSTSTVPLPSLPLTSTAVDAPVVPPATTDVPPPVEAPPADPPVDTVPQNPPNDDPPNDDPPRNDPPVTTQDVPPSTDAAGGNDTPPADQTQAADGTQADPTQAPDQTQAAADTTVESAPSTEVVAQGAGDTQPATVETQPDDTSQSDSPQSDSSQPGDNSQSGDGQDDQGTDTQSSQGSVGVGADVSLGIGGSTLSGSLSLGLG